MNSSSDSDFLSLYAEETDRNLVLSSGIRDIFFAQDCPESIKHKLRELLEKAQNISYSNPVTNQKERVQI